MKEKTYAGIVFQFGVLGVLSYALFTAVGGPETQNIIIGTLTGLLTGFGISELIKEK